MSILIQQKKPVIQPKTPARAADAKNLPPVRHASVPLADNDFGKVFSQKQESNVRPNVDDGAKRLVDPNMPQEHKLLGRQGILRPSADPGAPLDAGKAASAGTKVSTANPTTTISSPAVQAGVADKSGSANPTAEPKSGSAAPVEGAGESSSARTGGRSGGGSKKS